MKVLLTGAAGYIGSYVLKQLMYHGHDVIALDQIKGNDEACWIIDNLATFNFSALPKSIEAICHVAAAVAMNNSFNDIKICAISNILGTNRLIDWSLNSNVRVFVFTSTAGLYSRPSLKVIRKETDKISLHNAYLSSKWINEMALGTPDCSSSMACWALRVSSPYGAGQNPLAVLPTFIAKAIRGEHIEINGSGKRSQDFINVKDVACAHVAALEHSVKSGFFVVNVGSGQETSINELVDIVTDVFGKVPVRHIPDPFEIEDRFVLDIDRLRSLLDIHPVGLREGLETQKEEMIIKYSI